MTKVTNRLEIDLLVVIGECHLEVEVDMYKILDRIIGDDHRAVIKMTLGEEILGRHKTIEVRITDVDVETVTETIIETEAVVDQDQGQVQVQEPVQMETVLDVIHVENMTILLTTVLTQTQTKNQNKFNNCIT